MSDFTKFQNGEDGLQVDKSSIPVLNPTFAHRMADWIYRNYQPDVNCRMNLVFSDALGTAPTAAIEVIDLDGNALTVVTFQ